MAYWLDEGWHSWPEVVRAGTAAAGLYARCGSYIASNLEGLRDAVVPVEVARMFGTPEWIQRLVDVGLWTVEETGYRDTRYFELNWTLEKVKERRAVWARKSALFRDPDLRRAVRGRDLDMCRYCGVKVRWNDRRGSRGGTYDHVDPDGPNSMDNLVVACRGCNSSKRNRTPGEAGMTLGPVPDLDTTQNGSKSKPDTLRALPTTPKGVGGLLEPHPYPVGEHVCDQCNLPAQHAVHRIGANPP